MGRRPRSTGCGGDPPAQSARHGARWTVLAAAAGCMVLAPGAHAERWTASAWVSATEAYNHYSGSSAPGDGATTSATASVNFNGEGARINLHGTLSATETYYAGQGQDTATFAPAANVFGRIEAIERFFFVEATANVSQTYASAFGPQPANITVPTANRYTSETYTVSPYIKGVLASSVAYAIRDDNIWTSAQDYGNTAVKPPSTYWNNFSANASSVTGGPNGWAAEYTRQEYDPGAGTGHYILQLARLIDSFRLDPQLDVSARFGYENDRFPAESALGNSTQGTFYGAGAHWRPTPRTDLNGWWEHHYYGSSYSWTLTHRLPNVALSASLVRGLSSYPQLALLIPAGVPVAQFLDAAFATRIPDPAARAQAVLQFMAQSGLSPTLISPVNVYATTVTLQTVATATAVWIGALNSLAFTIFRSEGESVVNQTALPEPIVFGANSIQTGGGVSYSHRLTAMTNLSANASYTTAKPTGQESDVNFKSRNYNAAVALNTNFTPKTSGSVGVSYFIFEPDGPVGRSSTLSLFATLTHTF